MCSAVAGAVDAVAEVGVGVGVRLPRPDVDRVVGIRGNGDGADGLRPEGLADQPPVPPAVRRLPHAAVRGALVDHVRVGGIDGHRGHPTRGVPDATAVVAPDRVVILGGVLVGRRGAEVLPHRAARSHLPVGPHRQRGRGGRREGAGRHALPGRRPLPVEPAGVARVRVVDGGLTPWLVASSPSPSPSPSPAPSPSVSWSLSAAGRIALRWAAVFGPRSASPPPGYQRHEQNGDTDDDQRMDHRGLVMGSPPPLKLGETGQVTLSRVSDRAQERIPPRSG